MPEEKMFKKKKCNAYEYGEWYSHHPLTDTPPHNDTRAVSCLDICTYWANFFCVLFIYIYVLLRQ